jgi:hypothetical protein
MSGWVVDAFEDPAFSRQIAGIEETPAPQDRVAFGVFLDVERRAMRDILQRVTPS